MYGEVVGIVIARELEGTWVVIVLPFLDTGYLEVPGFSSVLDAGWLKLLPDYFPAQITINASFTPTFDVGHEFVGSAVYAWCLWLGAAALFAYATRSYTGPRAGGGIEMRRAILVGAVAVAAVAAIGYVAWPYAVPAGISADGFVTAAEGRVISDVTGRILALNVAEGQAVEAGQDLGVAQDLPTGQTTRLVAPIHGIVTKLDVKQGENVTPGQTVAEVYDLRREDVELDVEESFIGQVTIGQPVIVRASGVSRALAGHVTRIGMVPVVNQVDLTTLSAVQTNQVKRYPVSVTLEQVPPSLRLDMRVRGVLRSK